MAACLEILEMERAVYEQFIAHCYRFSFVSVVKLPTVWSLDLYSLSSYFVLSYVIWLVRCTKSDLFQFLCDLLVIKG